jgi:hypothetical protein
MGTPEPAPSQELTSADASILQVAFSQPVGESATIQQAQGILMALNRTDADAARTALQGVSTKFGISLPVLAEATIAIATTTEPAVDGHAASAVNQLLDPSLRIPAEFF